MGHLFNPDAPFWRFMGKAFDLMVLNWIFLLSCLPVVTIGASLTALYEVMFNMRRNRDCYLWKDFWKAWRSNFKNSTIVWVLYLIFLITCVLNFNLMTNLNLAGREVIFIVLGVALALLSMVIMYVFPMQALFNNNLQELLMKAMMMAVGRFPYTLFIALITVACLAATFMDTATVMAGFLIWIFIGFSLLIYVKAWIYLKAFAKVITEEDKEMLDEESRMNYKEFQ